MAQWPVPSAVACRSKPKLMSWVIRRPGGAVPITVTSRAPTTAPSAGAQDRQADRRRGEARTRPRKDGCAVTAGRKGDVGPGAPPGPGPEDRRPSRRRTDRCPRPRPPPSRGAQRAAQGRAAASRVGTSTAPRSLGRVGRHGQRFGHGAHPRRSGRRRRPGDRPGGHPWPSEVEAAAPDRTAMSPTRSVPQRGQKRGPSPPWRLPGLAAAVPLRRACRAPKRTNRVDRRGPEATGREASSPYQSPCASTSAEPLRHDRLLAGTSVSGAR